MRIGQIYAFVLLYFLLKAAAFDVCLSYQNGGKTLSIEKSPGGKRCSGINGAFFKTNY